MDDIGHFHGGDRRLFKIYEEAGSCDTEFRFHDTYQQTYFKSGMGAYQLDHVFADAATEARVVSWDVDESPATAQEPYSDHAPITVALDDGQMSGDPGGPVFLVPWTADMALRAANATGLPRGAQLERIRDAADEGRLPPAAINALVLAGYSELLDGSDAEP